VKARVLVLVAVVNACAATSRAPAPRQAQDDAWGRPEIALWSSGPFCVFCLTFALYSSGRVLFAASDQRSESYQLVTLTRSEREALIGDLPLNRVGHLQLPHRVGSDGATDCIAVWANGAKTQACLWGGFEDWGIGESSPPELKAIWKRLADFRSPRATPWVPDQVSVRAAPWGWRHPEEKCGKPVAWPWPKSWPKPARKGAVMPTWGWEFFVTASDLPELRRIAHATRNNGCSQPVALRGQLYEISYGVPLPHAEIIWRD
jgi:hypothetical protein